MPSLIERRHVETLLVVHAALVSGLVDGLAEPGDHSPAELSAQLGTDPRATLILLEALTDVGLAARAGEAFVLSPLGREHLVDPGPEFERHSLLHQVTKMRGWLELPYVLEHGQPPPRSGSRDARTFGRTMAEGMPEVMDEVVERCRAYARPYEVRRMLDAGGALGHIALRFARHGAAAVLCDRPEMLEEAARFLREQRDGDGAGGEGRAPAGGAGAAGVTASLGAPDAARPGQVALAACDFHESLPAGPFDLVYLGNVYHIYGPTRNAALTRRVFEVLAPGGVIAIRDFIWERSPRAAMFAVNMLQATEEGGVWREGQYREWLEGAGFEDLVIEDVERSGNQLLLGRKPEPGR